MILIKLLTIGALCAMTTGTPATADMLTDKTSAALKADALSDKTDTYVKAGLKDRFEGKTGAEWLLSFTTDAMYASAKACALDFKPGERFQYSDQGFCLLGMIIEKVGGAMRPASRKRSHKSMRRKQAGRRSSRTPIPILSLPRSSNQRPSA